MNSFGLAPSVVPLALSSALCFACGVPVDDSKYQVVEEPPTPAEQVVSAFAEGNESCASCLRHGCKHWIDACAETPLCAEFSKCVQAEANPAGPARCTSQWEDVTIDTVVAHGDLRDCWVECKTACGIGKNWSCLGDYSVTQPPRPVATVRQTFSYLCHEGPVQGATVKYCETEECSQQEVTDASGSYSVTINITEKGPVAGWDGERLVAGGELILPHRLKRNLPIWSDQAESTLLVSGTCANKYINDISVKEVEDTGNPLDFRYLLAVQFFDCQSAGAEGVRLEVPTAPEVRILYVTKDGEGLKEGDSSKAAGEGLALVFNVREGEHMLEAYETRSNRLIASAPLTVTGEDLVIYSIFPGQAPQ